MHLICFISLAAFLAGVAGNPLSGRAMAVHESVAAVPKGFAHAGPVSPSEEITLRISLAHSDIAGLEKMTYAVSDPASSLYGQHLTVEEVAEYVKPTDPTLSSVTAWLSEHGITAKSVSPAGDILQITVPVGTADALLATQFSAFTHVASGKTSIRTLAYSVPAALQGAIQFIHPTVAFVPPLSTFPGVTAVNHRRELGPDNLRSKIRAGRSADAVPVDCEITSEPACLIDIYGFPTAKANHSAHNTLGVSGFIDEFANMDDLVLFLRSERTDLEGSTFKVVELDGGQNDQTNTAAGIEANLDIQYTVGLAGGVPVTFFSVGDDIMDGVAGFMDLANAILAEPIATRPTVLTTSYGFNENELTLSLAVGLCNAYMQLGISVLFASGDGGVSGVQTADCTTFVPTAPGGCPFVTSVGGTFVSDNPPGSEEAILFSAGGFSNFFATPAYQAAQVSAYISSIGDQYAGLYNTSGRGLPDVAAQAGDIVIAWTNSLMLVDGTSCASPIFASMVSLINDRLIAAGKPVLGFLNPFLYSSAGRAALTDVTSGNNPGCGTDGFSASPGWDPISGLGTPNFDALLKAVGL
ncbi:family S53 protease [Mycena pura]|uniref:Family S53 protease n=1 Tax=Mycena pura TaxID=153505 RepID=A0AAD6UU69_9AGAR|nr:family S53 protease [Mycena pura]